mgnify:FL=1
MNERFLELATIAKIQMCSHERLQEFAELIVLECSKAIETMDARNEPAPHIFLLKYFEIK